MRWAKYEHKLVLHQLILWANSKVSIYSRIKILSKQLPHRSWESIRSKFNRSQIYD